MFMKKPTHRKFDYTPQFYDPLKDEEERKKRKLGFSSYRKNIGKKQNPIKNILLIIIVILIILLIRGLIK